MVAWYKDPPVKKKKSKPFIPLKNCCTRPKVKNLNKGLSIESHWYCSMCGSHFWMNKKYTAKAWDKWINEPFQNL